MFSLPSLPYNPFSPNDHLPIISSPLSSSPIRAQTSPLSPHSANVLRKPHAMSSPTPVKTATFVFGSNNSEKKKDKERDIRPFSKRPVKRNPLLERKGDDGRETRRKLFLKRVREDSEDQRWQSRGGDDEMMRVIWLGEQKRREEAKRREAQRLALEVGDVSDQMEELQDLQEWSGSDDMSMADEKAQIDQAEMEALLASLDTEDRPTRPGDEALNTPYGSDDEEYDCIFMEMLNNEAGRVLPMTQLQGDNDIMDMS